MTVWVWLETVCFNLKKKNRGCFHKASAMYCFIMHWYGMKKSFVVVCGFLELPLLKRLLLPGIAYTHCSVALCLNVVKLGNCHCATHYHRKVLFEVLKAQPLHDTGKALQSATLQCLPYANLAWLYRVLLYPISSVIR